MTLPNVWKCGGGTQSVAIGALIVNGRLPKPDYAVIADTGREKQSTWDYLDSVLNPSLSAVGVVIERVKKSDFAKEDIFDLSGNNLLIPAFTNEGGRVGKLSAFCSDKWKVRVADRWLRSQGVKQWVTWLGFSTDEPRRFTKHLDSISIWLPLVLGVRFSREDCVRYVESIGWPTPPRSNCWMCPNQGADEWLETKRNRPIEFAKAVALERELHQKDPCAFLHKSCQPLDEVKFESSPQDAGGFCNSGECFL